MSPTKLVISLMVCEIESPRHTITQNTTDQHIQGALAELHQADLPLYIRLKRIIISDLTHCPDYRNVNIVPFYLFTLDYFG